jgi:PAS domain S-box-containing protein
VRARLENDRLLQETHAYEERLRLAMQSPSLGTWDMDPDTLAVRWSDNTLRIFGFRSNRDLESRAPLERVHPDDRGRVAAAVAAALAACSDGVFSQRYRIVRPDGSIRWIRSTGQARFEDRDGTRKAVRLAGVLWDVTEQQQLIESLRDSEERARLALAGADMGVWRHDSATDVVEFDALAMAHYDFDRQAVQIAEVLARIHPDDLASMKQSMAASRDPANRAPVSMEYRVIDRSGREKWLAVSGRVHFERRDGVERWVRGIGTSRDVSEQKAAEAALRESEQRFRLLADSTPHIVWAARPDGYSDYFNERWYEFTGMPRPDEPGGEHDPAGSGQGWNWKDWLHPDDFQPTIDAWERSLATGEPYRVEYRFKRRDGQYRWFIGRALPLRDETGRITRWFGTLSDVHDQTVDALQREALIGRLREADNAKDEFLAMLAHEIRGPLGPVRTALAVLDREPLAAHAQRAVAIGRRQLAQVTHIVDDLLEASRITRGVIELRPERVMVQHVVRAAADSVEQAIVERGQRLRFDMPERPVSLYVDPVRLAQILENLLTNAAKYTDAGGDIVVRVRQAADEVRIEVADSGIGIAPEHLPRIFDLFAQVETAIDRSRGGLGIGLSLVKRLAEQHGGSVTARSEGLGRGSTFTLRLPG